MIARLPQPLGSREAREFDARVQPRIGDILTAVLSLGSPKYDRDPATSTIVSAAVLSNGRKITVETYLQESSFRGLTPAATCCRRFRG
jgi:hypothetical protein